MSRTLGKIDSPLVREVDMSGGVPGYTDGGSQPDVLALISDQLLSSELLVLKTRAPDGSHLRKDSSKGTVSTGDRFSRHTDV